MAARVEGISRVNIENLRAVDKALLDASSRTRLLGAATPMNAAEERRRMIALFDKGHSVRPEWVYPTADTLFARRALTDAHERLGYVPRGFIATAYAERMDELRLELDLMVSAGSEGFASLARRRFAPGVYAEEAQQLAEKWISCSESSDTTLSATSDGAEPTSLLQQLRRAVGELKLPFSVDTHSALASLAATGERSILVATGRKLSSLDVARTVLHEVYGHAVPRTNAARQAIALFGVGTAKGADEQEGYALVLEERNGFLTGARKRQLAARHLAVDCMDRGATFVDVVQTLTKAHNVEMKDAVFMAERAFRGGTAERAGLGRERVYLEAYVRVREHLADRPEDEEILSRGQVSVDQIAALRPFALF